MPDGGPVDVSEHSPSQPLDPIALEPLGHAASGARGSAQAAVEELGRKAS